MKGVRSGVERRRGVSGLKARDPGRRDAPGEKVLKDRRSPRRRGRTVWGPAKRERACTTLHTTGSSSGSNENEFTRSSRPPLDGDPGAAGPACAEAPRLPLASPPPPPETGRRAAVFASKLNVPSAPPDAAFALGFGFGFGFGFWGACGRETRTGCGRERARRASEVGRPAARRRSGEKVLKDRRPPRGRGRMGTSVRGEGIDSIDRDGDVARKRRSRRRSEANARDSRGKKFRGRRSRCPRREARDAPAERSRAPRRSS